MKFQLVIFLSALLSMEYAKAWQIWVTDVDKPIGQKTVHSMIPDEDFKVPDLDGIDCVVEKSTSQDKEGKKSFRGMTCKATNEKTLFRITTLCTVSANNSLTIGTAGKGKKKPKQYTVNLICD